MVGSLRRYQMALGAAGLGDDVMSISGPPGSAQPLPPGPLFPVFPGLAFRKGGLTRAGAGGGPSQAGGGGAGKTEPGGGRFVYQRKHYVIWAPLGPDPAL